MSTLNMALLFIILTILTVSHVIPVACNKDCKVNISRTLCTSISIPISISVPLFTPASSYLQIYMYIYIYMFIYLFIYIRIPIDQALARTSPTTNELWAALEGRLESVGDHPQGVASELIKGALGFC